jgi:hypothetical protein
VSRRRIASGQHSASRMNHRNITSTKIMVVRLEIGRDRELKEGAVLANG